MAGTVEKMEKQKIDAENITDDRAREVVEEIVSGLYRLNIGGPYKSKKHKEPIEIIYARRPTQSDINYFRDVELKTKNRLAREVDEDGKRAWYWQAEIEKDLEARGLWTENDRKELQEYQNETIRALIDLRNASSDEERRSFNEKYEEARTQWVIKISKLYSYLDGSIEVQSKARTQLYRMQRLIGYIDNVGEFKLLWPTLEDIFAEDQSLQFKKIVEEFVRVERGYDEDFLELL